MILLSTIGPVTLGYRNGLLFCEFGKHKVDQEPNKKLAKQIEDYFEGKKIVSFDAPIQDATLFTRNCWRACREIPYGTTISYQDLAIRAGSPKASRAAGQAMRRNPLTIITPCHRVISSKGLLHGYSGVTSPKSKELKRKQFLIELEQRTISL